MGTSQNERFVGLDGVPETQVGSREAHPTFVVFLTQPPQYFRPMGGSLPRQRYPQLPLTYFQTTTALIDPR